MKSTEHINDLIRAKYNDLNETQTVAISASDLAEKVYEDIDPERMAPALVKDVALLELRQLARAICRNRYEHDEDEAEQDSLFAFQLQPR